MPLIAFRHVLCSDFSCCCIIAHAVTPLSQSVGRRSLAIKLLEEEPSAAQQVPLLISLAKGSSTTSSGQSPLSSGTDTLSSAEGAEDTLSRALRKAVDARDPDLVYLALFAAYRSRPLPEFWKMVGPRPTARNLFVKYTRVKVSAPNAVPDSLAAVWLPTFTSAKLFGCGNPLPP